MIAGCLARTSYREPTLRELLDDPVVQDVMRSDGVSRADVERAFAMQARRRFRVAA